MMTYKFCIRTDLRRSETIVTNAAGKLAYPLQFSRDTFLAKIARTILSRNCAARNNQNEKLPVCLMSQHARCVAG